MSSKFEMIKKFYGIIKPNGQRMWTDRMVHDAVIKNWITAEEYEAITGKPYQGA